MDHSLTQYMPHGHCYLWEPALVGIHVVSDILIGLAYLSISISLYLLIRKIKMPFSPIVLSFGVFIGACGLTHFVEVWNLWNADYWFGGWVKVLTALASVITGLALIRLSPKMVAFATAAKISEERGVKLAAAYNDMEERVKERTLELEKYSERERASKEQLEALYSEAQKANHLKDEFLATMSHELRTPLSVILGYSEMLVEGQLEGESRNQAIITIHRNAQTQAQLVNDLLDVSMIISGKMKLDSKIIDVMESIDDAIESVGLAAKAKNIHVSLQFSEESYLIYGDSMRLQQIIWNILSNAIKFTSRDGSVTVKVKNENSRCEIEISDSGQGIDPSFLPHVFERFTQEESGASRKFGGLGLGLGIVKSLTELHGGTVSVHSEGKGRGAKFTISLPLAPIKVNKEMTVAEPPRIPQQDLAGLKVLVIDDEPDVRDFIMTSLRRSGLKVEGARSAVEALSKLPSIKPDILICDIGMPDVDGYALIRMIREQEMKYGGFVPAIALTAYAQEGIRQKVLASGFQAYVTKPAQTDKLLREIWQLIGK